LSGNDFYGKSTRIYQRQNKYGPELEFSDIKRPILNRFSPKTDRFKTIFSQFFDSQRKLNPEFVGKKVKKITPLAHSSKN